MSPALKTCELLGKYETCLISSQSTETVLATIENIDWKISSAAENPGVCVNIGAKAAV